MPSRSPRTPRVVLVHAGGTIVSLGRHALDAEYMDHGRRADLDELLPGFPEVTAAADVVPVSYRSLSSAQIGPREWLELAALVNDVVARERADGVVITHGTSTLEETAYFLNLVLKVDVPVVLVGAQRPANMLSSDAGMNLLGAVRVAGSPHARGLGVLVLLNDEIHAAREVAKLSTLRLDAFRSPDVGMLGYADADGSVAIYRRPARRCAPQTEFEVHGLTALPRVDIALAYAGVDGTAVRAFVAAGARGIVSASLAPGVLPAAENDALLAARDKGLLIVLSSRAGSSRVLQRTVLRERRFVAADNLNPAKARVLAMLALTRTEDVAEVERIFATY
jgi:L-asparaginase